MEFNGYMKGYCVIRIEGENITAFTKAAADQGIPLFDIISIEPMVWQGKTEIFTLRELRYLAHRTNVFFEVQENKGLYEAYRKAKKRWYPIAVIAAVILLLAVYSQSVLGVRVVADKVLSEKEENEILAIAADYGIKPGFFPDETQWDQGVKSVIANNENLAWVGYEKNGVFVTLRVIVKDLPQNQDALGHIVAKKDGVVRKIFVQRGAKAVEVDTPVKAGDLLIDGHIIFMNNDGTPSGETADVGAAGIVEGSVWYTKEITFCRTQVKKVETGAYCNMFTFVGGETPFVLWGRDEHDFADVAEEEKVCYFQGMPLFVWKMVKEVKPEVITYTQKEMESNALKIAESQCRKQISKKGEIIDIKKEILEKNQEYVKVRVTLESYENLGYFQSFSGDLEKSIE